MAWRERKKNRGKICGGRVSEIEAEAQKTLDKTRHSGRI